MLGSYALSTGKQLPTFRMTVLPPSSGSNSLRRLFETLEIVYQPTRRNASEDLNFLDRNFSKMDSTARDSDN
jgi:hypothetical protein